MFFLFGKIISYATKNLDSPYLIVKNKKFNNYSNKDNLNCKLRYKMFV